jgi:hypothetical protein
MSPNGAHELRLAPERALADLDQAAAWVRERGMVTITSDCALPSLFAACHEEPYAEDSRGFGNWPATKYTWPVRAPATRAFMRCGSIAAGGCWSRTPSPG